MAASKTATKKLTKTEAEELVQKHLDKLDEKHLVCRDLRHAWDVHEDFHTEHRSGGAVIMRTLLCLRCATFRFEHYTNNRWGIDKLYNSYKYPEGYQLNGMPKAVSIQKAVRSNQYKRTMDKIAAAQRRSR